MATYVGTGNSAVSSKDNTVHILPSQKQDQFAEPRLRLAIALQTSLDLQTILEIFFEHLSTVIPVEGMTYENSALNIHALVGHECAQRVNYRLNTAEQAFGEIAFSRKKRFHETEMVALENLIASLIFPLRNALQYREAIITSLQDPLTGVGNRKALSTALNREVQLADRHQHCLSLLVIDIDHFKLINDTYGHSCGDDVLKELGRSICSIARQTDLTFRYGGEEFVVLLNKTSAEGATVIAERIRKRIEKLKIETNSELIRVTASIGLSTREANESGDQLFKRADMALYQAKNSGRNRVISAQSENL